MTGKVLPIVLVFIAPLLAGCEHGDPTDDAMIANFRKHRKEFELLRDMVVHDTVLHRLDMDWSDPADPGIFGITPQRIAEYHRLFRELGITRGFAAYGDRSKIEFIAHTEGLSVSGHAKNYTWS